MNEAMCYANKCIGYKLVLYTCGYTFDLTMYSSINDAYNVIMSKSLNDENKRTN